MSSILDYYAPPNKKDRGCDWTCDFCGNSLNKQHGFTCKTGRWTCTICGTENDVSTDNIRFFGEE